MLLSDTKEAIATSIVSGMIGFIRLYERDRICTCFRDRFEILAGAYLQWFLGIPVAHSWW